MSVAIATKGMFIPVRVVEREVPIPGGIGGVAVGPERQKPVVTVRLNTRRRIPTQIFITSVKEKDKEEE